MLMQFKTPLLFGSLIVLLMACSGSEDNQTSNAFSRSTDIAYSGDREPVALSQQNFVQYSRASVEAVRRAIENYHGNPFGFISTNVVSTQANYNRVIEQAIHNPLLQTNTSFALENDCVDSGFLRIHFKDIPESTIGMPDQGEVLVEYSDCDLGDGIVYNGFIHLDYEQGWLENLGPAEVDANFDLELTRLSRVEALDSQMQCSNFGESCLYYETFYHQLIQMDGSQTQVAFENGHIIPYDDDFNVELPLFHENFGQISVMANNIEINEIGQICDGTIILRDNNGQEASITFPDQSNLLTDQDGNNVVISYEQCQGITVLFDGLYYTYELIDY